MPAELDTVALTHDVPEHRLVAGDIGTVVHVYPDLDAFEVEFARANGETVAVLTLRSGDIRALDGDMLHARRLAS
jgi:hypothetical protein